MFRGQHSWSILTLLQFTLFWLDWLSVQTWKLEPNVTVKELYQDRMELSEPPGVCCSSMSCMKKNPPALQGISEGYSPFFPRNCYCWSNKLTGNLKSTSKITSFFFTFSSFPYFICCWTCLFNRAIPSQRKPILPQQQSCWVLNTGWWR